MNVRRILRACCAVALLVVGVDCDRPSASVVGLSSGTPQRIASLTLATDEMLSEMVPVERMACVTYLVDDPDISNVRGFYPSRTPRMRDADLEKILAIEPDLVCVAPYNSADFLRVIERAGISLYRHDGFHSIDQIEASIIALGNSVGEPQRAKLLADRLHARREQLADRLDGISERPRVLFWSAGFTAGSGTTMDDIIREAGAINAAAEIGMQGSVEISPERVIAIDPDVILLGRWKSDDRDSDIKNHVLLRNLRAVTENRTIMIEGRYLICVSQFVVEGAERLARALHPERFAEVSTAGDTREGTSP